MNVSAKPTRIFLSYARGDDEPFVRRLYDDLTGAGFTVWFDRESLMSRGTTFHQEIKDAIRTEVDRVVYVGGPKAAQSAYVREEWQSALEYDHVVVTPILRLGEFATSLPGELSLLHCEDFRDDAQYPVALEKLIRSLREPNPKLGALFAVPSLPANFIGRPELMNRVRDALLVDLQKPQVITSADARVGMQGMGGIGKSVLAAALARNREIRRSYPDGVVWVSFGQSLSGDDLLQRQRDVVRHLGGDAGFESLVQGQGVLRELLQAKAVLLVLDDLWGAKDAQPFDVVGPRCRMLVTTRDAGILHALHGELLPVSLFTESESLQLLADTVGVPVADLPPAAREVVRECGNLPLALALSGGMARKRGGDFASALERLQRADLEKIADRESINPQHRDIWRAMQASVGMLDGDQQRRFAELSVFFTDRMIPETAIAMLWAHTGGMDDLDTEELLVELAERSLIQLDTQPGEESKPRRRFRLHDLLYDYAARAAGDRKALHRRLLDAYRAKCPNGWHAGPNDGYFFENLCDHFVALEAWDALIGDDAMRGPLTELRFIQAKCAAGLVHELVTDYNNAQAALPEFAEENESNKKRDEAMIAHNQALRDYAVVRYGWFQAKERGETRPEPPYPPLPDELKDPSKTQVHEESSPRAARLRHFANFVSAHTTPLSGQPLDTLPLAFNQAGDGPVANLAGLRIPDRRQPWLKRSPRPPAPPLRPQCLRTLEGHTSSVESVSISPDGQRPISSYFTRLLNTVTSVSISPDGQRAVSGSGDKTLRVWDLHSGQCLLTLKGHTHVVESVSISPDGQRAVSGSYDGTLRVWDLESGQCPRTLEGHTSLVNSVSISPDGQRAVSGSYDNTLRVWDLHSGQCLLTLKGHTSLVNSVSISPDGQRAVSGSYDGTLRVWDLESGQCPRTLEGHTDRVTSVSISPDGQRAVSGSYDNTLRVWDLESGQCLAAYQAGAPVRTAAFSPSGERIVGGTTTGQMHFLTPVNFPPSGPAIVTAHCGLRISDCGIQNAESGNVSARCPYCAASFKPSAAVISAIHEHSKFPNPTSEMFSDRRLLAVCPHCAKPLKFNPFFAGMDDAGYEVMLRRGLHHCREALGDHPNTAAHLRALSGLFEKQARSTEASEAAREAEDVEARICPPEREPMELRQAAGQLVREGRYAEAEPILQQLLAKRFEVPGTHCHLARICLLADRFDEADVHAAQAWDHRAEAPPHVLPRILWFRLASAMLSKDECSRVTDASLLGMLKTALQNAGAFMEWTMQPVLDRLHRHLGESDHTLLSALIAALNDKANLPALDQLPAWRSAQVVPIK